MDNEIAELLNEQYKNLPVERKLCIRFTTMKDITEEDRNTFLVQFHDILRDAGFINDTWEVVDE